MRRAKRKHIHTVGLTDPAIDNGSEGFRGLAAAVNDLTDNTGHINAAMGGITRMSQLHNLSVQSRARIDAKLADFRQKTGQTWTLEVTKQPGGINGLCLLEIAIDGRITRPIPLESNHPERPADRICRELDRVFEQKKTGTHAHKISGQG